MFNVHSAPTRIRTRNFSLEARDDYPFHHRGIFVATSILLVDSQAGSLRHIAEGMGFEPTSPDGGTH